MKLSYLNEGRGGYIIYSDEKGELKFSFEYGGGDCVVIIYIPSPQQWESRTGRTPGDRDVILHFIAGQSVKDQVRNGRYVISDSWIEIFSA